MIRDGMKKRVLGKLVDSEAAQSLTWTIAAVENELLEAAKPLDDALGTDHISHVPDAEDRQAALIDLLRAISTDSMQEVWADDFLPELVDAPEKAERHIGASPEEWERTQAAWAKRWREAGAEGSDRALARHHVRDTFGVEIEEFEDRVVNFDGGQVAERLFAANFRAVVDVLDAATEEVDEGES